MIIVYIIDNVESLDYELRKFSKYKNNESSEKNVEHLEKKQLILFWAAVLSTYTMCTTHGCIPCIQ